MIQDVDKIMSLPGPDVSVTVPGWVGLLALLALLSPWLVATFLVASWLRDHVARRVRERLLRGLRDEAGMTQVDVGAVAAGVLRDAEDHR
jgi:hypothetical protein